MAKIIKREKRFGYWKCDHCGSEVSGKYAKCLSCGAPVPKPRGRQKSVYYLKPNTQPITSPTELALKNAGPDWICDHCSASNSDMLGFCDSCGNKRDEADYTRQRVHYGRGEQVPSTHEETMAAPPPPLPKHTFFNKKRLLIGGGILAVLAIAAYFLFFRVYGVPVEIVGHSWERSIEVQRMNTYTEEGWSVPAGGRILGQSTRFSHNIDVVDHYETRTVTKTRDVYDGEDTWTETEDNGDGTFSTVTKSSPRYKQESYTEQEEFPVYRQEPVYREWYTYDIDRWEQQRVRVESEQDKEPRWPEITLGNLERKGFEKEIYTVKVLTLERDPNDYYSLEIPFGQWQTLQKGQSATLKVKGTGKVVGLE